jgi:hypothetical protein
MRLDGAIRLGRRNRRCIEKVLEKLTKLPMIPLPGVIGRPDANLMVLELMLGSLFQPDLVIRLRTEKRSLKEVRALITGSNRKAYPERLGRR